MHLSASVQHHSVQWAALALAFRSQPGPASSLLHSLSWCSAQAQSQARLSLAE